MDSLNGAASNWFLTEGWDMSLFDVMPIKSLNGRNYFYNAAYNLISPAETYSEKDDGSIISG